MGGLGKVLVFKHFGDHELVNKVRLFNDLIIKSTTREQTKQTLLALVQAEPANSAGVYRQCPTETGTRHLRDRWVGRRMFWQEKR